MLKCKHKNVILNALAILILLVSIRIFNAVPLDLIFKSVNVITVSGILVYIGCYVHSSIKYCNIQKHLCTIKITNNLLVLMCMVIISAILVYS